MKIGTKIIVPKYFNEMKDFRGEKYYSFFHNVSIKNKNTGDWEIKERYVINVMNVNIETDDEIEITNILDAKPQVCKDKKGKEYLNCLLWVKADNLGKKINDKLPENSNNIYNVDEDDLPF